MPILRRRAIHFSIYLITTGSAAFAGAGGSADGSGRVASTNWPFFNASSKLSPTLRTPLRLHFGVRPPKLSRMRTGPSWPATRRNQVVALCPRRALTRWPPSALRSVNEASCQRHGAAGKMRTMPVSRRPGVGLQL